MCCGRGGAAALIGALAALMLTTRGGCSGNKEGIPPPDRAADKVEFTANRDASSEVYIMDSTGWRQTRLTLHPETDFQPTLRPDRQEIAITSRRDGDYDLSRMTLNGTGVQRLTDNARLDA